MSAYLCGWLGAIGDQIGAPDAIVTILMLLNSLNSCVNPWIYLLFNRNLMNALRHQVCRCPAKNQDPFLDSAMTQMGFHLRSSAVNVLLPPSRLRLLLS
ncbi:hypothetical protein HPB51_022195 [Rhipicephalus microplus]|uniref:G-protein coupled receptors family 1 profile domain-containing protein n=1 Tax=Rhipicephalus microplus TaxID=6941 RepID=A0A9J6F874_RHIMP|nr:hypothetical protein HPB51_022195 [Rhipicephalus microplus]